MRAGRLDYVLQFPIPDERDRLEIFQVHTQEKPLASDVDLAELARLTEGMAGSQIASICRSATMMAISEFIQASGEKTIPELLIDARHFKEAIESVQKKEETSCMLKAVRKKRAYEDIVKQIRHLIEKGRLKREDQLPTERELSETFKVSRATVREAIFSLETMKLVQTAPGQWDLCDRFQRRSPGPAPGHVPLSRKGRYDRYLFPPQNHRAGSCPAGLRKRDARRDRMSWRRSSRNRKRRWQAA